MSLINTKEKKRKKKVTYQHTWWKWPSCHTWQVGGREAGWSFGRGSSWALGFVCHGTARGGRRRGNITHPETCPLPGWTNTGRGESWFIYFRSIASFQLGPDRPAALMYVNKKRAKTSTYMSMTEGCDVKILLLQQHPRWSQISK